MNKLIKAAVSQEQEPLKLDYFEAHEGSFSARILRHLSKSPFFQPKLKKDGSPSDKDMLTVAATIIAVADSQIAKLEKRVDLFNAPMFQSAAVSAKDDVDSPEPEKNELGWLSRYLTLRNFVSAAVVLVAAIWAVFTWYTADKNTQLTIYKERYEASEKSRAAVEGDVSYWKKEAEDFKGDAEKKSQDLQKQQGRTDQLQKDLDAERAQTKQLLETLKKSGNVTNTPPAAGKSN